MNFAFLGYQSSTFRELRKGIAVNVITASLFVILIAALPLALLIFNKPHVSRVFFSAHSHRSVLRRGFIGVGTTRNRSYSPSQAVLFGEEDLQIFLQIYEGCIRQIPFYKGPGVVQARRNALA